MSVRTERKIRTDNAFEGTSGSGARESGGLRMRYIKAFVEPVCHRRMQGEMELHLFWLQNPPVPVRAGRPVGSKRAKFHMLVPNSILIIWQAVLRRDEEAVEAGKNYQLAFVHGYPRQEGIPFRQR